VNSSLENIRKERKGPILKYILGTSMDGLGDMRTILDEAAQVESPYYIVTRQVEHRFTAALEPVISNQSGKNNVSFSNDRDIRALETSVKVCQKARCKMASVVNTSETTNRINRILVSVYNFVQLFGKM